MITCQGLYKNFKTYQKEPGFAGTLKSFFKREYETKSAVKPFDIEIPEGEIVGLLGPNGAGKTTLIKMFTGIVVPSGGTVNIIGFNPAKRDRRYRKKIALVMGQKSQLWWDLPAMDSFQLLQRYYEIAERDFKKRVGELAELLDVQKLLNVHVRKLSLGERMKVELMSCLLHKPEVIFLDEPTIGLDLIAQRNIRQFIRDYHHRNHCTILLTSHYMADVEALCSRLVFILEGEKRFDGDITTFSNLLGSEKNVVFDFENSVEEHPLLIPFDPHWNDDHTRVELRIPHNRLKEVTVQILECLPVVEFNTEKLPIERVMKTVMENPALLESAQREN